MMRSSELAIFQLNVGKHPNDSEYVLWFIRKLERLASYLLVTAQDVNHRVDRYKWLLVEMESRPGSTLADPLRNIELTDWEKEQFQQTLDGEIYTMTHSAVTTSSSGWTLS